MSTCCCTAREADGACLQSPVRQSFALPAELPVPWQGSDQCCVRRQCSIMCPEKVLMHRRACITMSQGSAAVQQKIQSMTPRSAACGLGPHVVGGSTVQRCQALHLEQGARSSP